MEMRHEHGGDRDGRIIEAPEMTSSVSQTGYTVLININLERREKLNVQSTDEEYVGRDGSA